MKKTSLLLSILLAFALVISGCGSSGGGDETTTEGTTTTSAETTTAAEETTGGSDETTTASGSDSSDFGDYSVAYTLLGDDWMLNYYEQEVEWAALAADSDNSYSYVSAEFTSDTMLANVQSLIASGINGIIYYGAFPTLNTTISELCQDAEVPFVMPDQTPLEEQEETLLANPYFAGSIGADSYEVGYQMGVYAANSGYKTALTMGGAVGDTAHDGRIGGFEAGFTENGGTVVGTARCSSPSEATTKAADLLAAYPEADCFYCATGSYAGGAITAQENAGTMLMNFSTDLDVDLLDYVRSGDLAGDGGAVVTCSLAYALLQNYLDGHQILDENGNAPINTDLVNFIIDADNVDDFAANFIDEHPFSNEAFQKLLYRYNEDVTYDDFCDLINNWSLEYEMELSGR